MGFQKVPGQRQEQGFSKMGIAEYMHSNSRIYLIGFKGVFPPLLGWDFE